MAYLLLYIALTWLVLMPARFRAMAKGYRKASLALKALPTALAAALAGALCAGLFPGTSALPGLLCLLAAVLTALPLRRVLTLGPALLAACVPALPHSPAVLGPAGALLISRVCAGILGLLAIPEALALICRARLNRKKRNREA